MRVFVFNIVYSRGLARQRRDTINPMTAILQLHNEKIEFHERIIKEKNYMMNRLEKLSKSKYIGLFLL